MARRLDAIAKEINETFKGRMTAKVEKSWSSTDSQITGTRLRRVGKGRSGRRLEVTSDLTGRTVYAFDNSETYRKNKEVEDWLVMAKAGRIYIQLLGWRDLDEILNWEITGGDQTV